MSAYASATLDISDVERGLDAMQRRAHRLGPAFGAIKAEMKLDQKDHRENQEGPDGKWAARSAKYVAAAKHRKKHKLPRRILGKLATAISYSAISYGAFGESRVKWSDIHQTGGRVGRGAHLPARVFLWISDRLLSRSEAIITTALMGAWGGR